MKKTIRMIALLVSITLFFQELPVITARAAQENQPDHQQEAEAPKEEAEEARVVAELVEKRTENEKYFLLSDGTFQVAQYAQPVHYKDSDGYTEINNELVEATDAQGDTVYKNTESDFHVAFAKKADSKKLVTVTYEDHEISWGFVLEGQGRKGKKQPFSKPGKSRKASAKSEDPLENTRIADAGSYVDLYPGVDVKYELVSKQLKENIILRNKKAASQALVIEVRHPGLTAEKTPEGAISLADEAGRQIYLFEVPYMYDSSGETSDQVSLDIIASKNGRTRLNIVPDRQWLADSTRTYPVTIDPITKTAQSANRIETRYYTQNNKNLRSYGVLYAGNQKGQMGLVKTAVRFDLPKLPTTTTVLKATMYLGHRDYSSVGVSASTINVCAITENWTASESEPGVVGQAPEHSPYALDYNTLNTGTKRTMVSWDITGIASQWFNGTMDNRGVLVYPENPEEWALTDFVSPQNTGYGSGALPIMVICYREACGLEDYWSYSTQDSGRYGKGYVNNYNGNLVYIHEDVSFQSVINGFTLAHVYNTCESDKEGRYGKGWRLNLVQRLEPVSVSGFSEYKYVYTDGDGTRHYFYENENGKIIDEDGLGYTVSDYPGTELTKKITTKDGTELIFDVWHYLRVIRDANGNTINMNYAPIPGVDNYLANITTSSGGVIRLHYDSEYKLKSIEDNAGRITYYNQENGLLKSIVYPDGVVADLDYYDSWFHGISASDGTVLAYGNYVKHGKIYCAEKKSSEKTEGEYYIYTYGHNQTTLRDHFGRKTTYQFDNMGRAVCVFDDEKNVCAQQYTVSSNEVNKVRKNNKVTGVSNAAVYVNNLIKNPVFSDELSYWSVYGPGGSSSISISNNDKFLSGNSVRIHNNSEAITVIMQAPAVDTGTEYTFSAYIKTEDVVSERFGAGIEVVTSGRYLYSDMLTGTTDTDIQEGYRRVSYTFELTAGESLVRITAGLYNATGTAYVDGLQLEKGEVCNTVNLLGNSGFEHGTVFWTAGTDAPETCRTDSDSFEGSRAYRIDGRHDKDRSVSQTVYCSGPAGTVFAFGAWTKGYSVSGHEAASPYRLECTLHYTDGSEKTETVEYNTVVNAWQFGMKNLVAEKPYTYAQITFRYNKNCNFAVLDDVFLYRDSMQSYRYDDQGNVVTTSDYASQRSEYKYNNDNLSRLFTPEGSSYEYLYDEKKNNVAARNGDGLLYQIMYDGTGNPIRSDITASDATASIKDGGIYRLRLKYTGKYLALKNGGTSSGTEVVQAPFTGGEEQKWRVEKTTDGYYRLRPVSAGTLALDFDSSGNGTVVAASGADSQKLTPIPQSDYTYKLLVKGYTTRTLVTVNYSPTREAVVALYEMGIENNPEQEWYLEEAGSTSPNTIEEGIYQVQSRACGKVFTLSEEGRTELKANEYRDAQRFMIRPVTGTEYYTLSPAGRPEMFLCLPQGEEDNGITLTSDGADGNIRFQIVKDTVADSYRILAAEEEGKMISLSVGGYEDTRKAVLAAAGTAPEGLFTFQKTSHSITTSQSYQYNGNLPYQVTDARGNTTTYTYDYNRGLQTAVTDARGNTTSYTYHDDNDRLLSVTAGGSTVNYAYHADGTPSNITSPSGTVYGFAYDKYKRQTGVTVGGAQLSATQYRNNYQNLVDTITYGNGSSIGYSYDRQDRLTEKRYNGSVTSRYSYDRLGRLACIQDLTRGTVTEMQYDLTGRLLSLQNAKKETLVNERTYTQSREELAGLYYVYDELNRVSRIRQTAAGSTVTYGLEYATANTGTKKLGRISGISVNGMQILDYAYDVLGRGAKRTLGTETPFVTEYTYLPGGDAAKTTALVETLKNGENTYTYTYDELGNITSVSVNGTVAEAYTYDALGQLTGAVLGEDTYTYTYDAGGNLTARTKNGETAAVYGYGDAHWADLLTSYNGVSITYDGIGNPLNWKNGETFTWSNGRQLAGIGKGGCSIAYTYDESGLRTSKTVNGATADYYWLNGVLLGQKSGSDSISFLYDETGSAFGIICNGAYYYYEKNLQGDIIGIIDSTGTRVVEYAYGVWGELLSVTGTMADTIGQKNPLRYRGYYYDDETGFYYAGSRYYDPEIYRFISPDTTDVLTATPHALTDKNLYAYCDNNPIARADHGGQFWNWVIGAAVGAVVGIAGQVVSDIVTSAVNRELTFSNWQTYAGAFVGGAVGGAILGGTGNVGLANAATGFVTTGVGLSLEKATGVSNKSWAEIGGNAVADGAVSYGLGKLPGIKKVTKGKNSMTAVYKSGLTKLRNGTAAHMSLKVIGKGMISSFVGGLAMDGYYGLKQHGYDRTIRMFVQ